MHVCIRGKYPRKDETNVTIGYLQAAGPRKWEKKERGFYFCLMPFCTVGIYFFYHTYNFYNETAS